MIKYKPLPPSYKYIPITLTNSQSSATPAPFQQLITIDPSVIGSGYFSSDLGNIRFYADSAFTQPLYAWVESGNSNTSTATNIWVNLPNSIPANSTITIYMKLLSVGTEYDGVYTGEAPQLSPTYGQYDDGVAVFDYYNVAPSSTSGWTIVGTAGVTTSAPTGSHFATTNALYANSANGDYVYRSVAGLTTNIIITYWVYSTGLGNLFFLTNSSGAGQMTRLDTRGGSDYSGLASTTIWTHWNAPSSGLTSTTKNTWWKYDTVITSTTANAYIGANNNSLSTLGTLANSMSVVNNGDYIGLVGDALGPSYITYWNGIVFRAYPPNNTMPSVSIGSIA